MKILSNILVTVVIPTYNSEKYIIDTLESVKFQDYRKVEMIICDDCSTDSTIQLCKEWCALNENSFVNIEIVINEKNRGIACNLNSGIKRAKGEWIKVIAGDDCLAVDCLSLNVDFVTKHHSNIVFSKLKYFVKSIEYAYDPDIDYSFFSKSMKEQKKKLLRENEIPCTPTAFIKKELIVEMSYWDERFPMMEDYPLWLKILENEYELSFMDEFTVYYRQEQSITRNNTRYISPLYLESLEQFYKKILFKKYGLNNLMYKWHKNIYFIKCHICINWFNNKVTKKFRLLAVLMNLFDYYWYKERLSQLV